MGDLESILNPYTRLYAQLHLGLDPGGGASLEYECSVTRLAAQGGLVYPMCEME